MTPIDELAALLRPAGGGLYLVSSGLEAQQALQRRLYGASDAAEVERQFKAALDRIPSARGVLLGVPSDVGAGFLRGANLGPQALREGLLDTVPDYRARCDALGLVDLGDVFVVPQLLHDEMLSEGQKRASRQALYPTLSETERAALPVSPLSICERALERVFALNPKVKPFVLGGDHSVAWPVVAALAKAHGTDFGIVQIDAHTDLLSERLGVKYCFGTWSFHASALLGGQGKLVQVGIRATRRDKAHWESTLGVKQVWAREVRDHPEAALDEVVQHLRGLGLKGVYFSNDIDGTDEAFADATGTPEPEGLHPDQVVALIRRLGAEVGLLGGDVMELAPPLSRRPDSTSRTVALSVRYLRETVGAALGGVL